MSHERDQSHASATQDSSPDREDHDPGRASRSALLRKPDHAIASGLVSRKARDANGVADGAEHAVAAASSSSGSPLPDMLMRKFESSLGADLSGVRVHTGEASATANDAVGAKAYTMGNDIHFGAGHYDPSSAGGEHLLAHEVAHTVQQGGGAQRMQFKLAVSAPGDSMEYEADRAADAMIVGQTASVSMGSGVSRKVMRDAKKETKAGASTETWDLEKAKAVLATFTSMSAAVQKSKAALARVSNMGFDLCGKAAADANALKKDADEARDKVRNVLAMANGLAKSENFIGDLIREKIVGEAVDVVMGPAKFLKELPVGEVVFGAAKKYVEGIIDEEYKVVFPPVPKFDVPDVTTDNADKLIETLNQIIAAQTQLGHATAGHQSLDPVNTSCVQMLTELKHPGSPKTLDTIAAIGATTAQLKVACVQSDKECADAMRNAVELEHQVRIRCVGALALEKRMWSEWLITNTPPEDYGMTNVAGHPNLSIAAHLEWLGLMHRNKDGKREVTAEVELQKWVGLKVIAAESNPFSVKPAVGGPGVAPAAKPSELADEYIVTQVYSGVLQLAPSKAPVNAAAEQDPIAPGIKVTVIDHLMPRGTVQTENGIKAATTGGGIAVASGSLVPVLRTENGVLVVDAAKAEAGTPYGQYDLGPGLTPDTYFPASHAKPGKPPTQYGYHPEKFEFQATAGSKEYYVLDGYHLENNLDTVVCKKD